MNSIPSQDKNNETDEPLEEQVSQKPSILKELRKVLQSIWQRIEPIVMPAYEKYIAFMKAFMLRLWATPIGKFIRKIWAAFMATRFGRWVAPIASGYFAYYLALYNKLRIIYIKIKNPPPNPIMAAMMMKNESIELDDSDIALTGHMVLKIIMVFFTILVLWAVLTKLDESVRAEGVIQPPSEVQFVQNRLPGSVARIDIALGDYVKKGEVMFRLEDEDVIANFDDNEVMRVSSWATQARLKAQIEGADEVTFPSWLEQQAPEVVLEERRLFKSNKKASDGRLAVIERDIKEKRAGQRVAIQQAKNLREEVSILEPLVEMGHESRLRLLNVRNNLAQAEGTAETSGLAADRSQDEYDAQKAKMKADSAAQLSEVNVKALQAGARDDAFRAKVRHADIRAPVSGIVSALHIKTVGSVLQGGVVMAEIVPDEKGVWQVQARLPAEDIANVYIGQTAQVSLSAYDVSRYGTLAGVVLRIAQNTTIEEGMPPFYDTIIEIPNLRFSKDSQKVEITAGTPVVVDIIGDKRSILRYIFTPLDRAMGVAFTEK